MSSPWKKQPEDVVDSILKRAEVSKIARRLQNRLALAQFKAKHGWEDLTLDSIEPKLEEEMRRKRLCEGDILSDSSSSASDLPYPTRTLMSSPLKAPLFSDAIGSSNGSSGHRKRTYMASTDYIASSPTKRCPGSPTAYRSFSTHATWNGSHQLAQSSPIKPRRQQHFTTSGGPDVSFFQQRNMTAALTSPNFAAPSDDDDDLLPAHSFSVNNVRSSPPRTPPMQTRSLKSKRSRESMNLANGGKSGEEGADLLLYLAGSPSPAVKSNRGRMERLSTPPPKNSKLDLPSSMMTTPGGGNPFPITPSQGFDFADFVNITPSPAQKPWRTPGGPISARTPLSVARRRLTFEEPVAQ
ncbi:hypothetical protein E4U43_008412 [Claviceps pusilla]|uniref:Cyclin-dependent kinase n=1 Tax=Claviceps pusilla TaxID=123648 RepID=A0A9P7ND52_9HYPO|nr:hypothetical protein E4U43_008412 [Claviceps pusilla]